MGKSNYMERMRQYQKGSFKGMTTAERKERYIKDVGEQAYNKAYDKAFEEDRNRTYGLFRRDYIPYRLTSESDKVAKPIAIAARKSAVTKGSDRFDQVTKYDDMLGRATNPYKYQPGGMRMYGDPKLGDQTFANIVYQESEAGKEEALKKQMEEAQADNTAMEEANAALQRQYAIGNRIEASGQTALRAGAQGLKNLVTPEVGKTVAKEVGKAAADPLLGQTPNWAASMIPNAAGETASLASGTAAAAATDVATDAAAKAAFTPSANIAAEAGTNLASKSPGMFGKLGQSFIANANPQHFAKVSPYAVAGNLVGRGISYFSDDDDATTMNFGEGAGGVISGAASGAGFGSIFGPAGTVVGGVVGGLYGLGKGIYQRNKARNTIGSAEDEKTEELNRIGAQMRAEGVKSREYSGYDFGRTLAKHGGPRMYQTAGFDMSMLANNNLPSGYTTYQDTEPHTAVAAPEDTFMNRVHKFAQNPVTQIQKAANMTPGGVAGRNTMDYAVDLINLPGAVSKVVQGASTGDPSKLAAGIVQSVPYAKPITKTLGVLENAGANVTNAYKTFANNTLRLGKDNSKYAMKGIVKNASPDFLNQEVTDSTLVDPRIISQESTRVDMPMYRFKAGGVKLPGGTMNPIPGSDAVEFKGKSHKQGGILLDEQTEVEGGETMDKVTMKNEGPSDYFFSKYLKLGGKSYAQRHKDILKKGGTQQDIDALAMSQEKTAGRNPGIIQMERGGAYQYQFGGYGITNNDYSNPPLRDLSGLSSSQLNAEIQKVGADPRLNQYAKDKQLTALYAQLNSSKKGTPVPSVMGLLQKEPSGYFRSTPGNFGKLGEYENAPAVQTPTPTNTSTSTAPKATVAPLPTAGPVDEDQVMFDNEQEAMAGLQPLPTINTSPAAKGKSSNDDLIMEDVNAQIADLEAKRDSVGLTKDEQKALNNLYRDVPLGAYAAGAAQMLPAAYAFLRKEKAQKLMGPAGRISSPKLDRVDFNKERSQNASDARALNKSIETSGSGPAGIIAKMAAFKRKQDGDMQIAVGESRANAGIQAQEAQMKQQADLTNVQNALAVDNVNTAMMENQRVADENRRYMAIDKLANTSAGLMGDVMSYKANERMARAIGSMGIYEREKLFNSMLGKVNPRTGRPYTKDDIAELYNISLEDNNLLQEAQTSKDMENMSVYERAMAVAAGRKANGKQGR